MAAHNQKDFPRGSNSNPRDLYYVKRAADAELLDHCLNARPTFILQSPQMGKTSLTTYVINQFNVTTHQAVRIDLSQFPLSQREEDWFYNIVRILDDQLDLSTDAIAWWSKPSVFALPPYIRLTKLMTEVILPDMTTPIVLFIDEIERTTTLPFRDHFFEWLTSLYESRATNSILYRISFVISGVATPSQLIPEGGPLLFQWSHRVELSDFTSDETLALANKLRFHVDDTEEIAEWVYKWTNGHPYLTQLLFKILEAQDRTVWLEKEVDECIQGFIMSPEGQHEPHFQFIRTALTEPDANGVNLLGAYLNLVKGKTENLKTNQIALEQLKLIGILREDDTEENTELTVRNALYQEIFSLAWVKRHLFPQASTAASPSSHANRWFAMPFQPSNLVAASLFLLTVLLLIWFLSPQASKAPIVTTNNEELSPQITSSGPNQSQGSDHSPTTQETLNIAQKKIVELEATIAHYQQLSASEDESTGNNQEALTVSQKKIEELETIISRREQQTASEQEHSQHNQEALVQAEQKIDELETTIARYQDLSETEATSFINQRTLLETELASQKNERSTLSTQVENLTAELRDQQQTYDKTLNQLQTKRDQLQAKSATLATTLATTLEEVKTLQMAVLKKSSLPPSEINQLVADRSRLDTQLQSTNIELAQAHNRTRELESLLTQQERLTQTEQQRHMEAQTNSESQIRTLETTIEKTRQALAATEVKAQDQAILTREELIRLKQDRTNYQERLTTSQQELLAMKTQTLDLQAALTQKSQAILEEQDTVTQLQAQLTQTKRELNSATTRITSLGDQLSTAGNQVAQKQEALQAIHASSSEQKRRSEEQATKLAVASSALQIELKEKHATLLQAQQTIAQLTDVSTKLSTSETNLRKITKERDRYTQKFEDSQQQLAKAEDQIKNMEQSLRVASSKAQDRETEVRRLSKSEKSAPSHAARQGEIVKTVSKITEKLTQSPSPIQSKIAKLLWARQAYELNLQTQGTQWSTIDRSLRDGLHASPVTLKGGSGKIHTITFDPSGDHVIAGTSDGEMLVWSIHRPLDRPMIFTGHTASILSTTVSPNGRQIASGSLDSTIRLWDIADPRASPRILQAHEKGATSLAFRPDGKELASASRDQTIRLWDLTNEEFGPVTLGTHAGRVNAIAYTPNGKTLLSGGDDLALRVWDLQRTESPPKILKGHRQSITTISIHPFGWMVATGSRDRQIGLWDLRQSLTPPTFLTGSKGRVSHIQFSTDGTSLASVSSDKSLRIWNWQEPYQPPIQFPGHKGTLEAVAISPDGRTIAVGGSGQSVTLWTGTGQLAHTVCDTAQENLSFAEWKQIVGENIPYERTCPNLPLHPTFVEEGKKLARQGAHKKAKAIFERAKKLDPYLKIDLDTELKKLSAQLF